MRTVYDPQYFVVVETGRITIGLTPITYKEWGDTPGVRAFLWRKVGRIIGKVDWIHRGQRVVYEAEIDISDPRQGWKFYGGYGNK